MAPPSVIDVDGQANAYKQLTDEFEIQEPPEWAIRLVKLTFQKSSSGNVNKNARFNVAEVMQGINKGNRDNALYRYACHLKGCGVPYDLALAFIKEASVRCIPPMSQEIAVEKVQRAYTQQQSAKHNQIFSLKKGK